MVVAVTVGWVREGRVRRRRGGKGKEDAWEEGTGRMSGWRGGREGRQRGEGGGDPRYHRGPCDRSYRRRPVRR